MSHSVDVSWESLDSATISRLFVRHPHLGLQAAQLARRVLVFHRGAGVARMTSCFFEEKFDMLIDRLFTDPFRRGGPPPIQTHSLATNTHRHA